MTARAIADAILASIDAALGQLPSGTTLAHARASGALAAAANNAAAALGADPIGLITAAMAGLEGASKLTINQPGERADVEIGCVGYDACRDLAAQIGAPPPQTTSVDGRAWTWSTLYRDDGTSMTVSVLGAAQERAA